MDFNKVYNKFIELKEQIALKKEIIIKKDLEELSKIDVLIPAIYELKIFNTIVEPLFQNIRNNIHENQKLTALRDTLLAKLMSGEIEV